jgi:hypothetical protein
LHYVDEGLAKNRIVNTSSLRIGVLLCDWSRYRREAILSDPILLWKISRAHLKLHLALGTKSDKYNLEQSKILYEELLNQPEYANNDNILFDYSNILYYMSQTENAIALLELQLQKNCFVSTKIQMLCTLRIALMNIHIHKFYDAYKILNDLLNTDENDQIFICTSFTIIDIFILAIYCMIKCNDVTNDDFLENMFEKVIVMIYIYITYNYTIYIIIYIILN